uniref:Uncharacterized protein n=1 Tax=Thermogemmatispora argillosa TaxID=2045280 RepID=A0A455T3J3_9CHLR|nr:hypothetical protein KTA_33060 [Thermogemmatispora argillosa]
MLSAEEQGQFKLLYFLLYGSERAHNLSLQLGIWLLLQQLRQLSEVLELLLQPLPGVNFFTQRRETLHVSLGSAIIRPEVGLKGLRL